MLEGYEISYHPIENEDPNDRNSEAYQEMAYLRATARTGWPGAIDAQYLSEVTSRSYLVVVNGNHRNVVRILRTPLKEELPPEVFHTAMVEVLHDIHRIYPYPEYDSAYGGYCLLDLHRTFPATTGWDQVPIEQIEIKPKISINNIIFNDHGR